MELIYETCILIHTCLNCNRPASSNAYYVLLTVCMNSHKSKACIGKQQCVKYNICIPGWGGTGHLTPTSSSCWVTQATRNSGRTIHFSKSDLKITALIFIFNTWSNQAHNFWGNWCTARKGDIHTSGCFRKTGNYLFIRQRAQKRGIRSELEELAVISNRMELPQHKQDFSRPTHQLGTSIRLHDAAYLITMWLSSHTHTSLFRPDAAPPPGCTRCGRWPGGGSGRSKSRALGLPHTWAPAAIWWWLSPAAPQLPSLTGFPHPVSVSWHCEKHPSASFPSTNCSTRLRERERSTMTYKGWKNVTWIRSITSLPLL